MRGAGFLRRLRASRQGLEPSAFGERPRAAATGRMLGRSQPDASCDLVLLDRALVLVVMARRSQAQLYLYFEDLAYFERDVRTSGKHAYEVWDHGVPDGPRGVAFALKENRRGAAFVALLEDTVRRQRPDLLSGHSSAEIDLAGHGFMEPSDLWPDVERQRHPDAERLSAVLGAAYRRARRKPEEQTRKLLDRELRAAGLSYPQESKDHFVRSLAAEPPWLVGTFLGRFYRRRRVVEHQARKADVRPREDPELEDLSDRLFALPGVSEVSWNSLDCDRVIYVGLDPWSEETAEQVHQHVALRVVRFIN